MMLGSSSASLGGISSSSSSSSRARGVGVGSCNRPQAVATSGPSRRYRCSPALSSSRRRVVQAHAMQSGWNPQQQPMQQQQQQPPMQQQQQPQMGQAARQPMQLARSPAPYQAAGPVFLDLTQVLNKQVITRTSGRCLGCISGAWLDPAGGTLVSFDLDERRQASGGLGNLSTPPRAGNIPLSSLRQIGDVVLVHDESGLYEQDLDGRLGFVNPVGLDVRTRTGEFLGKVRDLSFSPDTGAIRRITYDEFGLPFLPISFFDCYSVAMQDVITIGRSELLVYDDAKYRERKESAGLFAAIPSLLKSLNGPGRSGAPQLALPAPSGTSDMYRLGGPGSTTGSSSSSGSRFLPSDYTYEQWQADLRRWEAETGMTYEQYLRVQQQQPAAAGPRAALPPGRSAAVGSSYGPVGAAAAAMGYGAPQQQQQQPQYAPAQQQYMPGEQQPRQPGYMQPQQPMQQQPQQPQAYPQQAAPGQQGLPAWQQQQQATPQQPQYAARPRQQQYGTGASQQQQQQPRAAGGFAATPNPARTAAGVLNPAAPSAGAAFGGGMAAANQQFGGMPAQPPQQQQQQGGAAAAASQQRAAAARQQPQQPQQPRAGAQQQQQQPLGTAASYAAPAQRSQALQQQQQQPASTAKAGQAAAAQTQQPRWQAGQQQQPQPPQQQAQQPVADGSGRPVADWLERETRPRIADALADGVLPSSEDAPAPPAGFNSQQQQQQPQLQQQ